MGPVVGVSGPQRWKLDGGTYDIANTHTVLFPAKHSAIFVVDVRCGAQFSCPADFTQFTDEKAAEMADPLIAFAVAHELHTRNRLGGVKLEYVGVAFSQPVPDSAQTDVYRYKVPLEQALAMADGGS